MLQASALQRSGRVCSGSVRVPWHPAERSCCRLLEPESIRSLEVEEQVSVLAPPSIRWVSERAQVPTLRLLRSVQAMEEARAPLRELQLVQVAERTQVSARRAQWDSRPPAAWAAPRRPEVVLRRSEVERPGAQPYDWRNRRRVAPAERLRTRHESAEASSHATLVQFRYRRGSIRFGATTYLFSNSSAPLNVLDRPRPDQNSAPHRHGCRVEKRSPPDTCP